MAETQCDYNFLFCNLEIKAHFLHFPLDESYEHVFSHINLYGKVILDRHQDVSVKEIKKNEKMNFLWIRTLAGRL